MELKNENGKKYFMLGTAGALILGGLVFFLSSGGAEKKVATVLESTDQVASSEVKTADAVKIDRFANIERLGFFAYDSAELNTTATTALTAWAEKLTENTGTLLNIEGHCDERGSKSYNLKLGKARANAVKSFLISKGVDSTRLHTISFGESRASSKGADESAYAQNRRFEVKEVSTFAQN